jgi:hypothetical protein
MKLSKKQQKLWTVIVAIASIALIATSVLPFLSVLWR